MKKLNFSLIILFFSLLGVCQEISYGVKGGLLYNSQGKLIETFKDAGRVYRDNGRGKTGWQIGGFAHIKLPLIYLQPELLFSHFSREYKTEGGTTFESKFSRLDLPILVGTRVFYLLRLYMGPVMSVNLNSKVTLDEIKDYKSDAFNMGLQFGVGVDLSRLSFDIRWERGLSKTESRFVQRATNSNFSLENRPSMLLLNIGYRF